MSSVDQVKVILSSSIDRLAAFVADAVDRRYYFDYRNYYGDSFTLFLLQQSELLTPSRKEVLIDHYYQ